MPNEYKLFEYQEEFVNWISHARPTDMPDHEVPACVGLNTDEPGLGKTAQALVPLRAKILAGKTFLFLVPGATIIQWQKNFDRWILDNEPDPYCTTSLYAVRGSDQPIPRGVNVVMSHNLLAKAEIVKKIINAQFDGIVVDEIHRFGAQGTKRIKHLRTIQNLSPSRFEEARIGLSGTPIRNYAKEFYNIAHFLDPLRYRTFEDFVRNHLTWDGKALRDPRAFHAEFAPYYMHRKYSEVNKDMPPIWRKRLYTEITDPFLRSLYNKNVDLMANFMNASGKLNSFSLLGYLVKLRRITGFAKAGEPSILEPILEYLSEGKKPVLGIHHHAVSDRLKTKLAPYTGHLIRGGMSDQLKDQIKNEFIAAGPGHYAMLSIKAAGEGVDGLQYASTKAYVFEQQWNGREIEQFTRRIHRTGQTQKCEIEETIAVGTVDEFFVDLCDTKDKIAATVTDQEYESNPAFLKELAERVINNRLPDVSRRDEEILTQMGIRWEIENSLEQESHV